MSKKLYIKSFGCQMNVYDSDRMIDVMAPHGYAQTDEPEEADLIVLNTCHIREKAAEKVYSELGRLKPIKTARERSGERTLIAVAGCVAQAEGDEIKRRQPMVDLVFGPQTYHKLPGFVAQALADEEFHSSTEFPVEEKFEQLPAPSHGVGPSTFLTIQEGCDKFCTFCVVPYTRGAEFSRPANAVLDEAASFASRGVREITLLGQNVNAYRGEAALGQGGQWSLAQLVVALAEIEGLERIRYTTSHPRDMTDDLIETHASLTKLMPYLHLPVQSGSDRILKAMNRGHSAQDYVKVIERVRAARPDIALSSDFIVGFPGETDKDFEQTLALVREIGYAQSFSFKYSRRPGTPGADMPAQVPEAVKSERLAALQALLSEQQIAFNTSSIGQKMAVLLEKPGRHEGQIVGRSPYLQSVQVDTNEQDIGRIVDVRITEALNHSLRGKIAQETDMGIQGSRIQPCVS